MNDKPSLKVKGKLRLNASSFKIPDLDARAAKLFDQIAQQNSRDFVSNPKSKNFNDFQSFIEFISPKDFDRLPDKKRREEQRLNKGPGTEIHPTLLQAFYMRQSAMNDLESAASKENFMAQITENSFQTLEKRGKCLSGLYVDKMVHEFHRRYLLYMIDCNKDIDEVEEKYKDHPFEIDDQVAFCYIEHTPEVRVVGSVYQKLNNGIVISIDRSAIETEFYERFRAGEPFSLVKQEYQAAFTCNNLTLGKVSRMFYHNPYIRREFPPPQPAPGCEPLVQDLLRESLDDKENEAISGNNNNIEFFDSILNQDQRKAVKAALAAKNLYLIDGPTGTGKTRVLEEVIHQCVKKGLKVLACGPSVRAVDNLIGRMLNKEIKACRIGKPENPDENIDRLSMDTLLKKNKRMKMIHDEYNTLLESFKPTEYSDFLDTMNSTAEIESKEVSKVMIDYADVVFSTLRGAGACILEYNDFSFDVLIIDECSQATELSAWAAILRTKKLIIAGDRFQLPPFIRSEEAKNLGLNCTLFDRLRKRLPSNLRQMLRVQYRMNEKIMAWSNEQFYQGKLVASDICAQYTIQEYLKDSSQIKEDQIPVLMLVDTKNFGYAEKRGTSYSNIGEAAVVLELLEYLIANYNLRKEEIGLISPYQDQNELITKAIGCKSELRGVKCKTVDYFQGKEREVIIISLVRSNKDKTVGFLDDARRMNVAMTRANRFVAMVCDTSTICTSELPFMLKLIAHFKNEGQVLTPDDFKGVGYQTRFLRSVLNGEIIPPAEKKRQAKTIENMGTINQVLNRKDIEEEEKIQEESTTVKERKKKWAAKVEQGKVNPFIYRETSAVANFLGRIPVEENEPIHSSPQNRSAGGMNYSHSKEPELENQDESEEKSLVGNSAIFIKTEPKKKKKNKQVAGGGIQIKSEDFPELG